MLGRHEELNMLPIREGTNKYLDWHNSMLNQVASIVGCFLLPSFSLDYRIPNSASGSVLKGSKNLPLA